MKENYSRRVTKEFERDPLLRFAYVYGHLGPEMAWGLAWPSRWKEPRFWLVDAHGSRRECDTFPQLQALVEDPAFDPCQIGGYFVLMEKTPKSPFLSATIRAVQQARSDGHRWELRVRIDGSPQSQVVGAHAQAEKILDRAVVLDSEQLKKQTAVLFEKDAKSPMRAFIGRIVEGVTSNLLASAIVGAGGIAVGWMAGRATG